MNDEASMMRHSIRGCLNSLKLGTSALETELSREDALEFLFYVEQASDKMIVLMDQWEALPASVIR